MFCCVVVGLASADLSGEFFGRRFNQQPIAIFNVPEPSDIGKALVEFFSDMKMLGSRGMYVTNDMGRWIHKPFLKGHLADVVASYTTLSRRLSRSLPLPMPLHMPITFAWPFVSALAVAFDT